jgi:hypothetical protein
MDSQKKSIMKKMKKQSAGKALSQGDKIEEANFEDGFILKQANLQIMKTPNAKISNDSVHNSAYHTAMYEASKKNLENYLR